VVTGQVAGDGGVRHGDRLLALAGAIVAGTAAEVAAARAACVDAIGAQATVDAIGVAAMFNGITRVADATGIPLDRSVAALTVEMREATGIDAFAPAAKWA
jgi:hypothetical protein